MQETHRLALSGWPPPTPHPPPHPRAAWSQHEKSRGDGRWQSLCTFPNLFVWSRKDLPRREEEPRERLSSRHKTNQFKSFSLKHVASHVYIYLMPLKSAFCFWLTYMCLKMLVIIRSRSTDADTGLLFFFFFYVKWPRHFTWCTMMMILGVGQVYTQSVISTGYRFL